MAHGELPPRSGRREPRPERQAAFHVGISAESRIDDAAELVNVRQRRRIAAAAEIWLAANADDSIRDIRFDAILVAPGKIP